MSVTLDKDQRAKAWSTSYEADLDALPNSEISAEIQIWLSLGAAVMARIGSQLLKDRRRDGIDIGGGVGSSDLLALWQRSDQTQCLHLVKHEGMCLVSAIRLVHATGSQS